MSRIGFRWLAGIAAVAALLAPTMNGAAVGVPVAAPHVAASGGVKPNAINNMDCNGHSPVYKAVKPGLGGLCTDPVSINSKGEAYRFLDNGQYVGHDEPSVKFISSAAGTANNMTYFMRLSTDPNASRKPTINSPKVSKYGELSIAPWFGLPMCDPKSYPQNPCAPDSDANSGASDDPNGAGSAFMELQFYPPGFAPFLDAISCDPTKWCAALTIDSLSCTFGFATCNNNCIEPVNFAFLQRNGVPAGPPSPQLADISTFTPNGQTLKMSDGDVLAVSLTDSANGLVTTVHDYSTGQTGSMVGSAANGFMNTNMADCSGTPFNFHPEYSSAKQQNQVPWAALEGGVLMQQEIGHFEACASLQNSLPFSAGPAFSDPKVFQTCVGGNEGLHQIGEGPCNPSTGECVNATTQNGAPCPSNNFASGFNCEFSDGNCMPAGSRTASLNGHPVTYTWPIAGCLDTAFQNGDLDFDGTPYQADWLDGSSGHPSSFQYVGPFSNGQAYPKIQFQTNVGASEILCDTETGAGCTAQPAGAAFYPFWSLGSVDTSAHSLPAVASGGLGGICVWNFGNVIPGQTQKAFGKTAQYGTPNTARFGGTLISAVVPNPQLSTHG